VTSSLSTLVFYQSLHLSFISEIFVIIDFAIWIINATIERIQKIMCMFINAV